MALKFTRNNDWSKSDEIILERATFVKKCSKFDAMFRNSLIRTSVFIDEALAVITDVELENLVEMQCFGVNKSGFDFTYSGSTLRFHVPKPRRPLPLPHFDKEDVLR